MPTMDSVLWWPIIGGTIALTAITFGAIGILGWLIARRFLEADHHAAELLENPEQRGLTTERFQLVGATHNIIGWIIYPDAPLLQPNACVLMVHGFDSSKDKVWTFADDPTYRGSMLDQGAESLARAGFHVAAIDLRGHGESDDFGPVTLGARESDDVLATIDYLIEHSKRLGIDPARIGVRGESMGGATALIAAARDQQHRVASLWIDSAYADAGRAVGDFIHHAGVPRWLAPAVRFWLQRITGARLEDASPLRYIAEIDLPVALVHSTADTMIPVWHFDRLRRAPGWQHPPETWQLERHEHNRLWQDPAYWERQIDFFRRTLAPATGNATHSRGVPNIPSVPTERSANRLTDASKKRSPHHQ